MGTVFTVTAFTFGAAAKLAPSGRSGRLVVLADKASLEVEARMATLSAKRLMRIVCWGWQFGAAVGIATAMAQVLSKFSHSVVCLLFHAAARKINDVAHIHFAHRASYSPLEINGRPRFVCEKMRVQSTASD